jgi:hypothetical protein
VLFLWQSDEKYIFLLDYVINLIAYLIVGMEDEATAGKKCLGKFKKIKMGEMLLSPLMHDACKSV